MDHHSCYWHTKGRSAGTLSGIDELLHLAGLLGEQTAGGRDLTKAGCEAHKGILGSSKSVIEHTSRAPGSC